MDYIKDFDIRLEKEMYYAGEQLHGNIVLNTIESFKLRGNFVFQILPALSFSLLLFWSVDDYPLKIC